ncbi:hypothetical protein [Psychrobacillus sp. MER TA 171]|uniref:hypothetical protein n=1 Tax=Psychrobacillus sp. MER TA 171 TaxID=2939577 RepID=UPI00204050A7|nr:hypothetical protein [Psychrobacillus sp. MER TA 171]
MKSMTKAVIIMNFLFVPIVAVGCDSNGKNDKTRTLYLLKGNELGIANPSSFFYFN